MDEIEKIGLLYLGRKIDPITNLLTKESLLYESKNLTTHAVCVGMTGSGKTGLGMTILEEAALDKIPAIIIDPKGDLGNLLLTFPNLRSDDFKPWIDVSDAERKGMNENQYAAYIAKTWKDGLEAWGENSNRIKKFKEAVDIAIYTPASTAGIPISIMSSFAAPPKEQLLDTSAIREQILSITSSLLGLLGIDSDPIKSREHILISTIIQMVWAKGQNLDISSLIQQVQKPPFTKIGALDIDTFYPHKDRMALSVSLNSFLASPAFHAWTEGEPLDIQKLLYGNGGKPKLSIISIAHLSDPERMFFVALLLNKVLTWMRKQSGTSSLRALLYMDEIFGFFPPTAMPPSKLPMLTLLKQARAYGLGVVLATQNPVDLDYKGLANCGTWFIGKLQTDRDKSRVVEGLRFASNGEIDAKTLGKMLSLTGNRIFIMRSIYEKNPILFQTRWALSYMRGPLTLVQIASLKDKFYKDEKQKPHDINENILQAGSQSKPIIPEGIDEYYLNGTNRPQHYEPRVLGMAKLHFVDAKNKIDIWQDIVLAQQAQGNGQSVRWNEAQNITEQSQNLAREAISGSDFDELPQGLNQEKNYAVFAKELASSLYQNQTLTVYQNEDPKLMSEAGESEEDFIIRLRHAVREQRDELASKIREKYSSKIEKLKEKLDKAQEKLSKKQNKAWWQKIETFISFAATLIGAFFGRGVTKGTITQTGTTLRRAGQIGKDSNDTTIAEGDVKEYELQLQEMQNQRDNEIAFLTGNAEIDKGKIEKVIIRPRKSDITIEKVGLLWMPK